MTRPDSVSYTHLAAKTDSQTTKIVKQAKSLSQQYQYKEAKSVLSGHKGTTVDHLKKSTET